jgi:hypothetical protein
MMEMPSRARKGTVSAEIELGLPDVLPGGQAAAGSVATVERVVRWVLLVGFGLVLALEAFLLWQAWQELV